MANITSIDAAVPDDNERIRIGAQRIRETRAKLNEVITKVNDIIIPAIESPTFTPDLEYIYWDNTKTYQITIPAGYTKLHVIKLAAGGGGAGGYYYNAQVYYLGGAGSSGEIAVGSIDVVAGDVYTVTLGTAGANGGAGVNGTPGTLSKIVKDSDASVVAQARGGFGGSTATLSGPGTPANIASAAATNLPATTATQKYVYSQLFGEVDNNGVCATSIAQTDAVLPLGGYAYIKLSTKALE